MAKRRAQVVRDGISKCFQFLIRSLELDGPSFQVSVELLNRFLVFFPVGNIVARLQDGRGSSALIPPQRPSARYDQLGSVSSRAPEFTLPTSSLQQFLNDIVKRDR